MTPPFRNGNNNELLTALDNLVVRWLRDLARRLELNHTLLLKKTLRACDFIVTLKLNKSAASMTIR